MKLTLISLILLFLSSCTIDFGKEGIVEGTMKYEITYLQDEAENPIISLMPSTLDMTFKNNSVKMEAEAWMGVFKSTFIKHRKSDEAINMLKMMGKRYYYISDGNSDFLGVSGYEKVKITFDEATKTILNYKCKHAVAEVAEKNVVFDIYYTDQINIENPNANTPFCDISGVLMEFKIEIFDIKMHLKAKQVEKCEISDDTFEIPSGYKEVQKEEFYKVFSSVMQ